MLKTTTIKPIPPGWYWRRRYNDGRSKWKPVKLPEDRTVLDRTAIYEYAGPIPEPMV